MTAAFAIHEASQVGAARRHALSLAEDLGFTENRAGHVGLIASELGSNLVKYARDGMVLIRALEDRPAGVEIVSIDHGPGMDSAQALRDGYSTAASLGHGLGAIKRLSDEFDVFSQADGTVVVARTWATQPRPKATEFLLAAVSVAHPGETLCGDAWTHRLDDGLLTILVADGLGHGLHANEAATEAVRTLSEGRVHSPEEFVIAIHQALTHTRGAAVAVAQVDRRNNAVTFAGLGNVAGAVVSASGTRRNMVSSNGTAGHAARQIRSYAYPMEAGASLEMHSDGISSNRPAVASAGLWSVDPAVAAAVLYRDGFRGRDDATVVVVRRLA